MSVPQPGSSQPRHPAPGSNPSQLAPSSTAAHTTVSTTTLPPPSPRAKSRKAKEKLPSAPSTSLPAEATAGRFTIFPPGTLNEKYIKRLLRHNHNKGLVVMVSSYTLSPGLVHSSAATATHSSASMASNVSDTVPSMPASGATPTLRSRVHDAFSKWPASVFPKPNAAIFEDVKRQLASGNTRMAAEIAVKYGIHREYLSMTSFPPRSAEFSIGVTIAYEAQRRQWKGQFEKCTGPTELLALLERAPHTFVADLCIDVLQLADKLSSRQAVDMFILKYLDAHTRDRRSLMGILNTLVTQASEKKLTFTKQALLETISTASNEIRANIRKDVQHVSSLELYDALVQSNPQTTVADD